MKSSQFHQKFSFLRYKNGIGVVVAINLPRENENVKIDCIDSKISMNQKQLKLLFGKANADIAGSNISAEIPAYGIDIWEIR